jgi:hypothetical protein
LSFEEFSVRRGTRCIAAARQLAFRGATLTACIAHAMGLVRFAVIGLAMVGVIGSAQAAEPPNLKLDSSEAVAHARPLRFVVPALSVADRKRLSGQAFTASFEVDPAGFARGPASLTPEEPVLAKALARVLHHWRFSPKADLASCTPVADRVQAQISVPPDGTEPRIDMTLSPAVRGVPERAERIKAAIYPPDKPRYPFDALLQGVSADVWVLAWVDPDGVPTPSGSALKSDGSDALDRQFVSVSIENIERYRFPAAPNAAPLCVIVRYSFRINR